jgi:hypothetical protein
MHDTFQSFHLKFQDGVSTEQKNSPVCVCVCVPGPQRSPNATKLTLAHLIMGYITGLLRMWCQSIPAIAVRHRGASPPLQDTFCVLWDVQCTPSLYSLDVRSTIKFPEPPDVPWGQVTLLRTMSNRSDEGLGFTTAAGQKAMNQNRTWNGSIYTAKRRPPQKNQIKDGYVLSLAFLYCSNFRSKH